MMFVIRTIIEKEENDLISSCEIFLKAGLNFIIKKKAKMKAGIKIKKVVGGSYDLFRR